MKGSLVFDNGQRDRDQSGAQHYIGQKQYELSNHLGNVQATVSDLKHRPGNDLAWTPSLKSAYDYYPFGMLMPDRYVSDTTASCMKVLKSDYVWKWVVVYCHDHTAWPWSDHEHGGEVAVEPDLAGVTFNIATPESFASFMIPVEAGETYNFTMEIPYYEQVGEGAKLEIQEFDGENWTAIFDQDLTEMPNVIEASLSPTTNSMKVKIYGPVTAKVRSYCLSKFVRVQEDVLVDICDRVEDRYRFGFNGQEKVNEWAGVGNSLDFGARIYDSRVSRFLSLDPLMKKFPSESNYAFAGNSPIYLIDKDGEYKMSPNDRALSNLFTLYLDKYIVGDVQNSATILNGLKKYGQFQNDKEVLDILKKGQGPIVTFGDVPLGGDGYYSGGNNGTITIDRKLASQLNDAKNRKQTEKLLYFI